MDNTPAGINTMEGKNCKNALESLVIEPSEASGAGIPSPINAKNASVNIADGMENVIMTIICPMTFGRMCLTMSEKFDAPKVLAASTNS